MAAFPAQKLKHWFLAIQRSFPWREDRSPYAVWISEVMLQQTRAAVVIPYFLRWMERFPTVHSLAEASIDEVIKAWEGLGYYSRARNIHRAAKIFCEAFGGDLPSSAEELKNIPGLGPYTIGAIRSFAFQQKAVALDGNVLRLLSRYFCVEEDIEKGKTRRELESLCLQLLPNEEPWIVTEAMIELGATVCSPAPSCGRCPLAASCQALARGKTELLPIKGRKVKAEKLFRALPILEHQGSLLIRRVAEGRLMADLYEFPYFSTGEEGMPVEILRKQIQEGWGLRLSPGVPLQEAAHTFTRYAARLRPVHFFVEERRELPDFRWVSKKEVEQLPFSSGHRRVLRSVLSQERDWLPTA